MSSDGVPDGPCVPGQSIACGCDGGEMGAAACRADGSGYDACSCDGDPSGSGPGSGSETDGGSSPGETGIDEGGSADGGSEESGSAEISFERDIKPILRLSCGSLVEGCHARDAYVATPEEECRGWFSFEDAELGSVTPAGEPTGCPDLSLYERMVQLNSWQCQPDGIPIAAPGDPESSYMMMKIDGRDLCPNGEAPSEIMPPAGEGFALTEASRAKIEAWILAGAPDN